MAIGKQQLLSIGDNMGTLHIMEVPWNLRRPSVNEVAVAMFNKVYRRGNCSLLLELSKKNPLFLKIQNMK